jgi:Mlc titration factor MtfA (ptsG expression regulator)
VGWFRQWRRARVLRRHAVDEALWRVTVAQYPFTRSLHGPERERLRELVTLFLHEKGIHGAGGMVVREDVRIAIAVQACILILNLGLDYYRGWVEVIVYPDEFVAEREFVDEAGVFHTIEEPMTGESWERGPVILSWADANEGGRAGGYNVVIHEFAHKLDMLNGEPNGFPPLHASMSRAAWSGAFSHAYEDFCAKVDSDDALLDLDDYAAESPAEFFAVMSEAFFESPHSLAALYPDVYAQLAQFYRQDPAARMPETDSALAEPSIDS